MDQQVAVTAAEVRIHERRRIEPKVRPVPSRPVVIESSRTPAWADIRELWMYRSLILTLTARHIQVRYAQSVLGIGWAIVQPLMSMVVFTIIFAKFVHVPSDGKPYQLFSLAALVPWTYFATAISGASGSLSASSAMLTKVYFPRLALPLSYIGAALVDFGIGFALLLAMLLWWGVVPTAGALGAVPLLVLAMMLAAVGVGSGLAALDVQYRDVKHAVPFLIQVWMYASPIVYPMSIVPEQYRHIYALNPMAGIIVAFRSVLLGTGGISWSAVAVSLAVSCLLCAAGVSYFRRRERMFADVV